MNYRLVIKRLLAPFFFTYGVISFIISGKTTKLGLQGFRTLFVLTNGKSNDMMSKIVGFFSRPHQEIDFESSLSELTDKSLETIVAHLNKDGYYVFDKRLSGSTVDEIVDFAKKNKSRYLLVGETVIKYSEEGVCFDGTDPISPRYQFDASQIIKSKPIQDIIFNKAFFAIANKYLGTKPVMDRIAMWWSAPFGQKEQANAAQMYHFDLPRIKFIKYFVYLTDVDEATGPHCFVSGSHRGLPKSILRDGRLLDEDIAQAFGKDKMLELIGKRGTVLAVDTRGLHKGKPLISGHRLLFQLEYANSLFGGEYEELVGLEVKEEYEQMKKLYSPSFNLIVRGPLAQQI